LPKSKLIFTLLLCRLGEVDQGMKKAQEHLITQQSQLTTLASSLSTQASDYALLHSSLFEQQQADATTGNQQYVLLDIK
jgi:hypothetical protein